eukprot:TRINITY_DN3616_c0_g1_i1.p1 TRINITY_DN3616_c0_g1~~TRINITY_DN3616_c0_g1_i1.p1  ORF type:complete len:254 (-),score=101.30 TRINITY_DN3616_c0_g1_i1:223-984(-)
MGRGAHLKVDIDQCDDAELVKKYKGWPKRHTSLKNQKARKEITAEAWQTANTALLEERAQMIKDIEANVAARHFEQTGLTLEQEKKRRKAEAKDLEVIGKCVERLSKSNLASSASLDELSTVHKAINSNMHEKTKAQKEAIEKAKVLKEVAKKSKADAAEKKMEKLRDENPEKFAALEKAKKEKAEKAEKAKKEQTAEKEANKKQKHKEALLRKADKATRLALKMSAEAAENRRLAGEGPPASSDDSSDDFAK